MANFVMVLAFLVVLAVIFFVIANYVVPRGTAGAEDNSMKEAVTDANIKPIGQVNVGSASSGAAQTAAAAPRSGEQIFNAVCMACHASGAMGAPIVGHKDLWAPRAKQGIATLLSHATHGFNKMPPKGTCADCSEQELKNAIEYMIITKTGLTIPGVSGDGGAAKAEAKPAAKAEAKGGKIVASKADLVKGKARYDQTCMMCHAAGVAGAPKFGDKAAWAPRIAQGLATLEQHAIHGYKGMPPKGTCMQCSDQEIKDAIEYMTTHSE